QPAEEPGQHGGLGEGGDAVALEDEEVAREERGLQEDRRHLLQDAAGEVVHRVAQAVEALLFPEGPDDLDPDEQEEDGDREDDEVQGGPASEYPAAPFPPQPRASARAA